jgi:hypothetical protein
MKLMELVTSDDVDVIYRKKGQHRFVEKQDLELMSKTLESLMENLKTSQQ